MAKATLPQDGAVDVPPDINTFPVATAAKPANVVVADAYTTSPTAQLALFVPPFATGNIVDPTLDAKLTVAKNKEVLLLALLRSINSELADKVTAPSIPPPLSVAKSLFKRKLIS